MPSYLESMEEGQRKLRLSAIRYQEDYRNWPQEKKRRHRIRRALHELLDWEHYPGYVLTVQDGRLRVGPKEAITNDARVFINQYRDELIAWCNEFGAGGENNAGSQ